MVQYRPLSYCWTVLHWPITPIYVLSFCLYASYTGKFHHSNIGDKKRTVQAATNKLHFHSSINFSTNHFSSSDPNLPDRKTTQKGKCSKVHIKTA
jgi:hypothetical protein